MKFLLSRALLRLAALVVAPALILTLTHPAFAAGSGGPITKGPWTQHVTPTSAIVRVEVDPPAPVTLELGMSGPPGTADSGAGSVVESSEVRALHSILVQNLEPATRYAFTVRANGAQKYGAITTAPREDSGASFRFLVYGDNRSDDTAHAAIVRAMVSAPSDFLIHTGDFVDNGGVPTHWQKFFDIESPLTRERCIFSVVGNHELVEGAGIHYVRYFGPAEVPVVLPKPASTIAGPPRAVAIPLDAGSAPLTVEQLSGTFRWSNARFFLVNGMVDYKTGPSRAWLEKALADSQEEAGLVWRIMVVHHGPWSSGPHGDNERFQEGNIPDLLRRNKVDLVLAGHDHLYERGSADGLAYFVTGGGGAPVYRVKKAQATSRHYESVRHYLEASATAAAIQFVAVRPDGSSIERCALRKGAGWDCDGESPGSAAGLKPARTTPATTPEAAPSSFFKCGCQTVGSDAAPGARSAGIVALLGALAAAAALRARRGAARTMR